MKKVVVTGATSMIGVALIKECIKNDIEVLTLVRPGTKKKDRLPLSPLLRVCEVELSGDMKIPITETDFDVFYHFAWAHTKKTERNNPHFQEDNISATLAAVELAHQLGCKKFVGAGSQAEYGITNEIVSPNTPVNPFTAYGIAKYASGKLSQIYCLSKGMEHIWVRICSVFGTNDNDTTLINYLIEKFMKNEVPELSSGEQMWDYLFEDDAGRAFYLIGEKSNGNKVYCLGNGTGKKLKEYIEIIRETVNPQAEVRYGLVEPDGKQVCLDVDISELINDVAFIPEISFEDGIRRIMLERGLI